MAVLGLISAMALVNCFAISAHAEGDISGAVQGTWNSAKGQIQTIVDSVIFPVIDVILVVIRLGNSLSAN